MKGICLVFMSSLLAGAAFAQNYQYQYPYDPYSSSPKPQPAPQAPQQAPPQAYASSNGSYASGGGASSGDYGFDKLLSYGSLEARYNFSDFKTLGGSSGSSGLGVNLRAPLFKPLFLNFGLDWLRGTDSGNNFNFTTFTVGGGLYLPLVSRFHLVGEAGLRYDTTSGGISALAPDNFAVYLRPGVRFAATDHLEIAGSILFSTTQNLNDRVYSIDGYYALLSVLDLGFGMNLSSDVNSYHAGLRLRW